MVKTNKGKLEYRKTETPRWTLKDIENGNSIPLFPEDLEFINSVMRNFPEYGEFLLKKVITFEEVILNDIVYGKITEAK